MKSTPVKKKEPARTESAPVVNDDIILTDIEDIEDIPQAWFLPNRIPDNDVTIISGKSGSGKTFCTYFFARHVTNGEDWDDGTPCEQGAVLFTIPEGTKATFKRRLIANGVDISKCKLLEAKTIMVEGKVVINPMTLADCTALLKAIKRIEQKTGLRLRMIVFDPVGSFAGNTNMDKDADVRKVLVPLQTLADEEKLVILLVAHHNKGMAGSAGGKTMNSVAWGALPRAHWQVWTDKNDETLRNFALEKVSDGNNPPGFSFRITDVDQ
jgi:RecA-family ATPase